MKFGHTIKTERPEFAGFAIKPVAFQHATAQDCLSMLESTTE